MYIDESELEQFQQQQQQNAEINKKLAYQSPLNTYAGSIILLTNPENDLYKMELSLRGLSPDKDGNLRKVSEPLMNDEGINSVMSQAQSIVSQVTIMGNLNERKIAILIDLGGDTIIKDLMINRVRYGIQNFITDREKIHTLYLNYSYICMNRALEEGDRRFWKGSQMEITNRTEGQKQGQGLFQKILGWAK